MAWTIVDHSTRHMLRNSWYGVLRNWKQTTSKIAQFCWTYGPPGSICSLLELTSPKNVKTSPLQKAACVQVATAGERCRLHRTDSRGWIELSGAEATEQLAPQRPRPPPPRCAPTPERKLQRQRLATNSGEPKPTKAIWRPWACSVKASTYGCKICSDKHSFPNEIAKLLKIAELEWRCNELYYLNRKSTELTVKECLQNN